MAGAGQINREELAARLATLEEAIFGPPGTPEDVTPVEWAGELVRWATEMAEQHIDEVEDPDALWTCIGEVRDMVNKLAAARDQDAPAEAGAE